MRNKLFGGAVALATLVVVLLAVNVAHAMVAKTVSAQLKDADIHQVIKHLAKAGDLKVTIQPSVPHSKVTISLNKVPPEQALKKACQLAGVEYMKTAAGNYYIVTRKGMTAGVTKIYEDIFGRPSYKIRITVLEFPVAEKITPETARIYESPEMVTVAYLPASATIQGPQNQRIEATVTAQTIESGANSGKIELRIRMKEEAKIGGWSGDITGPVSEGVPTVINQGEYQLDGKKLYRLFLVTVSRVAPFYGTSWAGISAPSVFAGGTSTEMKYLNCPSCGKQVTIVKKVKAPTNCTKCKLPLSRDWQYCPRCGEAIKKQVIQEWKHCPYCGKLLPEEAK